MFGHEAILGANENAHKQKRPKCSDGIRSGFPSTAVIPLGACPFSTHFCSEEGPSRRKKSRSGRQAKRQSHEQLVAYPKQSNGWQCGLTSAAMYRKCPPIRLQVLFYGERNGPDPRNNRSSRYPKITPLRGPLRASREFAGEIHD